MWQLHRSNASDIDTAVNNKKLSVRYHLLNFLDDKSHSKNYSTRAVATTYYVAGPNDPKRYSEFYSGLFASNFQPAENAPEDRTDGELTQLAKSVGVDASVINCIKSGADVGTATTKVEAANVTLASFNANGTPFVWGGPSLALTRHRTSLKGVKVLLDGLDHLGVRGVDTDALFQVEKFGNTCHQQRDRTKRQSTVESSAPAVILRERPDFDPAHLPDDLGDRRAD